MLRLTHLALLLSIASLGMALQCRIFLRAHSQPGSVAATAAAPMPAPNGGHALVLPTFNNNIVRGFSVFSVQKASVCIVEEPSGIIVECCN